MSKKITDFSDGGALQTGDKLLIARSGSNLTIDGSAVNAAIIAAIPTKVSQLTNDAGYLTTVKVPTKTSDLTNDSGFLTAVAIPSSGVTAGSYTAANITVGADGRITAASNGTVSSGDGPSGGSGAPLEATGVVPGTYFPKSVKSLTVDAYGRLTNVTGFAHKAWRLRMDHTASDPADAYCSIGSLEFRTVAGTAQQATGGTSFSTATGNGSSPDQAFDNDSGSRWVGSYPSTGFPKYLGYIYASPIVVAEMMIQANATYPSETPIAGALEYSDDTTTGLDGTWASAATFTSPATWAASEIRVFQNTGTTPADQTANVVALQGNVASLTTRVTSLESKASSGSSPGGSTGGSSSGVTSELVAGVTSSVDGTSSSGHQTKGINVTPTQDAAITGISFLVAAVAGVSYTATIWKMSGSTLSTQVYASQPITPGAADPYTAKFTFPALTLSAGQSYAMLLTASTGLLSAYYTNSQSVQSAVLPLRSIQALRIDAVPNAQTSIEFAGSAYVVNLYTTVGGSTGGTSTRWDLKPPKAADFTDTSSVSTAGPLTVIDDADEGLLVSLVPVTGDRSSMILKPVPTTGDWSVTAKLIYDNNLPISYGQQGLAMYINGSTPCYFWGMDISRPYLTLNGYNPSGSYAGSLYTAQTNIQSPMAPPRWYRVVYTAATSTYSFQISGQGKLFVPLYTATDSRMGGKVVSIGVGFGVNQNPVSDGYVLTTSVPYWNQSF